MQNNPLTAGTLGGTFLSIAPHLQQGEVYKTVLLAIIGAIVSFGVSVLLKCMVKKHPRE